MSTPSKKRREARAKIFGPDGHAKRGYSIAVQCPKCRHGFKHSLGTLDPAEGKCAHTWEWDPCRGPRGGIACTNCDLFISDEVMEASKYAPERDRWADLKKKPE